MVQTIKNKINDIRSMKVSKLNAALLATVLIVNAVIVGFYYFLPTYRFNVEFLRANVVQLIIIILIGLVAFYITYEQMTRKKPTSWMILGYLFALGTTLLSVSGLTFLIERLSGRATFSISTVLMILFTFLFFALMLGRYDFALTESKEKLFVNVEEHFIRNLGVYLVLFFISAWVGLVNGIFTPVATILLFIINLYSFKALLSNFRK